MVFRSSEKRNFIIGQNEREETTQDTIVSKSAACATWAISATKKLKPRCRSVYHYLWFLTTFLCPVWVWVMSDFASQRSKKTPLEDQSPSHTAEALFYPAWKEKIEDWSRLTSSILVLKPGASPTVGEFQNGAWDAGWSTEWCARCGWRTWWGGGRNQGVARGINYYEKYFVKIWYEQVETHVCCSTDRCTLIFSNNLWWCGLVNTGHEKQNQVLLDSSGYFSLKKSMLVEKCWSHRCDNVVWEGIWAERLTGSSTILKQFHRGLQNQCVSLSFPILTAQTVKVPLACTLSLIYLCAGECFVVASTGESRKPSWGSHHFLIAISLIYPAIRYYTACAHLCSYFGVDSVVNADWNSK
jgi:hypothetical protein